MNFKGQYKFDGSKITAFADVSEAEINPLLVKREGEGEGVVAVDGLVLLKR